MDSKFMNKFMEIGGRIGANKYMTAIRDGFAYTMPLIMAGALAVMFNNVLFSSGSILALLINNIMGLGADEVNAFSEFTNQWISPWLGALDAGTLSLLSLALVGALAYIRAEQEDVDRITTVLVAIGAFFILAPLTRVSDSAPWITHFLGAMGLFVALFTGIIASNIYIYFTQKGWTIKMPEMVPPAVGKGFAAIIPGGLTFLAFAVVPWLFATGILEPTQMVTVDGALTEVPITNIFQWVEHLVMTPLMELFGSADPDKFIPALIGVTLIDLLKQVFWFFGLHGANMIAPVNNSIWGLFDTLNVQSYAQTGEAMYLWTSSSWTIYVNHGGSGATLGLLIAMKFLNKRPDSAAIAKLSAGPGIFQINEPIIFGIPMVLNPIYAIPFVFISPILTIISFTSVWFGFGGAPVNTMPWTTPPIIGAALATNFDWESIVLSIITLALAAIMYAPFVLLANKEFEKQSGEELE